jgi:hypothetical protein
MSLAPGCGACNLCCRLLAVPDIYKPARMLCWWTGVHGGCSRHHEKPTSWDPTHELMACAQFECLWLTSQTHEDPTKQMPRHLRPDQCHVVMGPPDQADETLIYIQVDPDYPSAWLEPEVEQYLAGITERGGRVEVIVGENSRVELGVEGGSLCVVQSGTPYGGSD